MKTIIVTIVDQQINKSYDVEISTSDDGSTVSKKVFELLNSFENKEIYSESRCILFNNSQGMSIVPEKTIAEMGIQNGSYLTIIHM